MRRISGRLHMIDLEPDRIGIRAADGVDWSCSYPEELEPTVKALVDSNVWGRGVGQQLSAAKGTLRLEEIHAVGEHEETPLFTFERVPLADLMEQQGITGPQGRLSIMPSEIGDEELDAFLDAILDE
jgi:hypothetical protein